MNLTPDTYLPVELVFNPNWWHKTAGISFEEAFYLDTETRIGNDVIMRRVLHERYGEMGLGEADPQPRPIIGSMHVAGGFVIPALLGASIRFAAGAAPQPEPVHTAADEIDALRLPDWKDLWPMKQLIADMDSLKAQYGYVVGDLNTDGLLNVAYHFYGQDLFVDFYAAPDRVRRFLRLIGGLIADVARYIHDRTGSYSIAVNRMAARLSPSPFLHANCSVQMISPESYRDIQFPIEQELSERLRPFGIHHCGDNLQRVAPEYARLPLAYCEVGWGSDVARVREALPDVFLNLRLSPIRMLQCTPREIAEDTEALLRAAGPLEKTGVCCINLDYGTPDDNLFAMFDVVRCYR